MTDSSCAQRESDYRTTEAEFMRIWKEYKANGTHDRDQHSFRHIPSWLNAPAWANFVQFCKSRGWVFTESQAHRYEDGVLSGDSRMVLACDVPGVRFFHNRSKFLAEGAPFWVRDRRAGKAMPEDSDD